MSESPDSRTAAQAGAEGLRYMMGICGAITKEKGFDVSSIATQVLLIATEVDEALEQVGPSGNDKIGAFRAELRIKTKEFEAYRKSAVDHADNSQVRNLPAFLEEMADICIRVFSFIEGNGLTDLFLRSFAEKVEKNEGRPFKHGKAF